MPYDYQEKLAAQAHQQLRKAKYSTLETKRLEMKIKHLDAKLLHTTSLPVMMRDVPVSQDSLGHNRMLLADIKEALVSKMVESERFSLDIESKVNQLDSSLERLVLKRYYLDGLSIDAIADELSYCKRHILRVKREALMHFFLIQTEDTSRKYKCLDNPKNNSRM